MSHDPLNDLRQRLEAAEAERARQAATLSHPVADYGAGDNQGFRLVIEFAVPIVVSVALGVWLDRHFATLPWLTLIFSLLGFGAGIMNVFRLAGGYGAVGYRKPHQPSPQESTTDATRNPRE